MLPEYVVNHMKRVIRAAQANSQAGTALVAMLIPGHPIPLTHTCGAVLDHDMVRIEYPLLGWQSVIGSVKSDDSGPRTFSIPLSDIVWIYPEVKEVR